jgi:hypothetical protein
MDSFSKIIGLYWYCNDYHNGMWSWQYRVLSNSNYKPGCMIPGIEDENDEDAQAYYDKLVEKFEKQSQ